MVSRRKKDECLFNAIKLVIFKLGTSKPLYITPDFVCSVHKELYAYYRPAAGRFRNVVYRAVVKSDTFKPVPPSEIKTRLFDLCDFVNNDSLKDSLYKKLFVGNIDDYEKLELKAKNFYYAIFCASYVHHQVTYIHPFTGGNGRLARLLMSMELANHKMYKASYPPLLNLVIKRHRDEYLDALGEWDMGKVLPFCLFLVKILKEAAEMEDSF